MRWAAAVPDGFSFAVKAPPRALRDVATFEERVRRLGDRLGPMRVVVESPRDDGLLALLLGSTDLRLALDLRDESWDGVDDRAGRAGERLGRRRAFRYLRFREPPHADDELVEIAGRIEPLLAAGVDVFAYFRHEDAPTAPRTPRGCSSSSAGTTPDRSRGRRRRNAAS